jgi:hypothetical protein
MKVKRNYTQTEVLESAKIGLEFEFYSSMNIEKTARSIAQFTKKRVVIPMSMSTLNAPKPLYHSPVNPTADIFKLEPDYSGGKNMFELVTGPASYQDARNVIIKMFEWIESNGYTTERCSVHVNISIDGNKVVTKSTIQNMSIAKFILSFDEGKVYKVFPQRESAMYARSIKKIRPNQILFYLPNLQEFNRSTLTLPANEKYYGVNFLKSEKGYLEYRYIGGAKYEKLKKPILDLIDYFILHLQTVLNFESFTDNEKIKFRKMLQLDQELYLGFTRHSEFAKKFPNIKVTADMNDDPQVLEALWPNLRDKLYEIMVTGEMKKGAFNYDSEVGRFQLKDTTLAECTLSNVEFVNCKVEGIINNSWFFNCEVTNSRIEECELVRGNTVKYTKITACALPATNVCEECYIDSKRMIINCEVIDGVIRSGEIGKLAKLSKGVMVVDGKPAEGSIEAAPESEDSYSDKAQDKDNKKKEDKAKEKGKK